MEHKTGHILKRELVVLVSFFLFFVLCAHWTDPTPAAPGGQKVLAEQSRPVFSGAQEIYRNELIELDDPAPLFLWGREETEEEYDRQYDGGVLLAEEGADITVGAWRYSYNARGIIKTVNYLDGPATAVVLVHPWGIDDENGLCSPDPCGAVFMGTPEKNAVYRKHLKETVVPFIESMRGTVSEILYSLPGHEDEIRALLYHSVSEEDRPLDPEKGRQKYQKLLEEYEAPGEELKQELVLDREQIMQQYFAQFPGSDLYRYEGEDFWNIPFLLSSEINYREEDRLIYDNEGYEVVRDHLKRRGIRNILLCGYAADVCLVSTTAGYENLQKDFNVFIVGDCTMAIFPARSGAEAATKAALCNASLNHFITQTGDIQIEETLFTQ